MTDQNQLDPSATKYIGGAGSKIRPCGLSGYLAESIQRLELVPEIFSLDVIVAELQRLRI